MKDQVKNSAAVCATVLALAGCATESPNVASAPAYQPVAEVLPSDVMNRTVRELAEQLSKNLQLVGPLSGTRVAVGSFVNIANLDETDKLGMAVAENMVHEMHMRGFGIVDFKVRETPKIRQAGDFVFSRDIADLKRNYNIHFYLSGTIARNADGAVINARLIQADNNLVVSTAQGFIGNASLDRLYADRTKSSVERVVVAPVTMILR